MQRFFCVVDSICGRNGPAGARATSGGELDQGNCTNSPFDHLGCRTGRSCGPSCILNIASDSSVVTVQPELLIGESTGSLVSEGFGSRLLPCLLVVSSWQETAMVSLSRRFCPAALGGMSSVNTIMVIILVCVSGVGVILDHSGYCFCLCQRLIEGHHDSHLCYSRYVLFSLGAGI